MTKNKSTFPPEYKIVRKSYADGREEFYVDMITNRWKFLFWTFETKDKLYRFIKRVNAFGCTHVDHFPTMKAAEEAIRRDWKKWISNLPPLIETEYFVDPEVLAGE